MYVFNKLFILIVIFQKGDSRSKCREIKDKIKINQDVNSQEKEMSTFNREEHQDDMI